MKKYLILFTILLFYCCGHNQKEQNTDHVSGFTIEHVDSTVVDNLEVLGRVWGFVKYHHPVFSSDSVDIDHELLMLLSKVTYASKEDRNTILKQWIDSLGKFESDEKRYKKIETNKDYALLPDLSWMNDTLRIGQKMSLTLSQLRYAQRGKNRYALPNGSNDQVSFRMENTFSKIDTMDCGYRLLGLFRFWNIVEYFSPYRNMTDKDWGDVLREYIPKMIMAEGNAYPEFSSLLADINDTHTFNKKLNYIFGNKYLPISASIIEDKLIVTSLCSTLGSSVLYPGSEIVSIDGVGIDEIRAKVAKYVACSNKASLDMHMPKYALMSANKTSTVGYIYNGVKSEVAVANVDVNSDFKPKAPWYRLLNKDVGYLRANAYSQNKMSDMLRMFADIQTIIVDIRGYPAKGFHGFVFSYLIKEKADFVLLTHSESSLPGYFFKTVNYAKPDFGKWRTIVLVDENAVSSSEYLTMALQSQPGTITIGSQTQGADGDVAVVSLPGNISTWISGLGVYYPDGTPAQRVGVRIDHYVKPSIAGTLAGKDEVLEKAMDLLFYFCK